MTTQTDVVAVAIQALTEALRAAAIDPVDQIRLLSNMATYNPAIPQGVAPVGQAIQAVQEAVAGLCRRAALTSLARACAAYAPSSYNDALTIRQNIAALLDTEIEIAADGDDVQTYLALRQLRASVVLDLNTRAATLPALIEVVSPLPLPAFTLAYKLYGDAARADDLITRADPIHPAFMPVDFVALSA